MQTQFRRGDLGWLLGFLGVTFGAAVLGGIFTARSVKTWYQTLRKPSWKPPDWLFGPVWTTLYTMMAVSAWLVQRKAKEDPALARAASLALAAWLHQLGLNVLWSWIFFGRQRIRQGLGVIIALWFAIVETIWFAWRVSPKAALLLAPYLAWTTFAGALNLRIWWLNRSR